MIVRPQVWVRELAARFWAAAGDPPPFPRDLRLVLDWWPTVHVVEVPNLTPAVAVRRFTQRHIPCGPTADERRLAGCFAGHRGIGVILFDPTLDPADLRFTLAHELAHYLRDFDDPRRRVAFRLGERTLEVLDGLRPATEGERLAGVLRGVPVVPVTHFLDRDRWGRTLTAEATEAEAAADRLAYELLAPFDALAVGAAADRATLSRRLVSDFGFPTAVAAQYAAILVC